MGLISDWRAAVAADLALEYPDARVVSGSRTGKVTDQDTVAVFWPGFDEYQPAVVVGEAALIVRYWPKRPAVRDETSSPDPSALEEAAINLATFLQTKQLAYSSTGVWFCRLVSVTPDYDADEWGVEARIVAQFDNPAVLA